jgi:hypothetical protein
MRPLRCRWIVPPAKGLCCLLVCLTTAPYGSGGVFVRGEMEAQWTPNPNDADDGGPLPLSTQQRQELLRLEDAIRSSPDPQGTLVQVAQANEMEPQELANLLNRNRQDMTAAGGGAGAPTGGSNSSSRNVWQTLLSLGVFFGQWAKAHPRLAATLAITLLLTSYTSWTVPRTGLVLSTRRSPFSKGATTLWNPPTSYLEGVLKGLSEGSNSVSSKLHDEIADLLADLMDENDKDDCDDNTPIWLKLKNVPDVKQAVTVASVLDADDLRGRSYRNVEDDIVLEAAWEQALGLLESCSLTEFVQPDGFLRLVVDDDDEEQGGLLVVRGMGDWYGYGLLPLQVTSPDGDVDDSTLTLTLQTKNGAHFDGQIHVQFDLEESSLTMRVSLLVPKRGKPISRTMATRIVQALIESMQVSLHTRTRQALARQSQSVRFQTRARDKAKSRRSIRATLEQSMEEMSVERRRRWQRKNPNSGSYRPSGDRLKSPLNAMYR